MRAGYSRSGPVNGSCSLIGYARRAASAVEFTWERLWMNRPTCLQPIGIFGWRSISLPVRRSGPHGAGLAHDTQLSEALLETMHQTLRNFIAHRQAICDAIEAECRASDPVWSPEGVSARGSGCAFPVSSIDSPLPGAFTVSGGSEKGMLAGLAKSDEY
jgi:hypothetical protein